MISRSETEIAVIAQFTSKDGKADELLAALHHTISLSLNEPGCRRLILYQNAEDPRICTVIEKFADQKSFDAHLAASYTSDLLKNIIPRLTQAQSVALHKEVFVLIGQPPAT